ncbi:MAG: peroxiredoxin [Candidatus Altiarchaeota archaeon]|nr:peroxiredoxin [Candidatus Altiarchaeota archaeon]
MTEKMPLIGEKAPEFEAQTTQGKIKFPKKYKGKWVVLFSHPADFTPVCTTEFVAFQRKMGVFKKMNTELIGLSIDQVFSHIKWTDWIKEKLETKIEFPIIADDQGEIAKKLGMIHPGKGANTVRAVFIIDPKSIIRAILYYPQELGRNMEEIRRMVEGLRTADKHKIALPANWPENELIQEQVILPPAQDQATAEERLKRANKGEIECKDWWFCYKKLKK